MDLHEIKRCLPARTASRWTTAVSTALVIAASSALLPAFGDVIRFDAGGRAKGEPRVSAVQRYDAAGRLIVPQTPALTTGDPGFDAEIMTLLNPDPAPVRAASASRTAGAAAARSVALRYRHHPALKVNNITPAEWAALFEALVKQESGFNPRARSHKGAIGYAQLMPGTATKLGVNPHDPAQNLDGGARYLLAQLQTFKSSMLALAAYNAGPGAVQKYRGVPPYRETRDYVIRVLAERDRLLRQ